MIYFSYFIIVIFLVNVHSWKIRNFITLPRITRILSMTRDSDPIDIPRVQNLAKELVESLESKKRSYTNILVERFAQNIDDSQLSNKISTYTKIVEDNPSMRSNILRPNRKKIVVLGTGWASYSFLKSVDSTKFDVSVISPRNYFMFTPMLAASAVGTVEFKSICDPIRNVNTFIDYLEATATNIDTINNKVECFGIRCEGTSCSQIDFEVPYDYLIVAVGAKTNTYGIKGVEQHCLYLKQIEDAANIRRAIVNCFERANVPNLTEEEIRQALRFVIVGGGPTGVEFTSELRDWLEFEGRKYYSKLLKYVQITLVEAGSQILPIFDEALRQEALKQLTERETKLINDGLINKEVTTVILKAGVTEVTEKTLILSNGESMSYGFCVWAAGNGALPFVQSFISSSELQSNQQSEARGRIVTDGWLKVLGTNNIFSIGDCACIKNSSLPATAQVASQQGAYLGRLFSKNYDMNLPDSYPPIKQIKTNETFNEYVHPEIQIKVGLDGEVDYFSESNKIGDLSTNLVVSQQQGERTEIGNVEAAIPFQFLNLGVLAYVGGSKALAQVSVDKKNVLSSGTLGYLLWRGIYWFKQVSWRNRVLVGIDWLKARLFGRDIGCF